MGHASASVPAGATRKITIKLNAAGRALLARFHRLPMRLAVVQQAGGSTMKVASQNVAIVSRHR